MYKTTLSKISLVMKQKFSDFAEAKQLIMKPIQNKDDKRIPDVEFTFKGKNTLGKLFNEVIKEL